MAYNSRMSGILPTLVLVIIFLTDRGEGGSTVASPEDVRSLLPTGLSGLWGDGHVEKDVWAIKGSSVVLPCHIPNFQRLLEMGSETSSGRDIVNVTWVKDNETLLSKRSFITPDGLLNITKLVRRRGRQSTETDDGEYRCILALSNGVPWVVSGPPIYLHVADIGRQVNVSSPNVSLVAGEAFRLQCQISSDPPALYRWEKIQGELPQDGRISQFHLNYNSGVLQITNVQKSDAGNYKCFATNTIMNKTRESDVVLVSVKENPTLQSAYIPPTFLAPSANFTLRVVEGQNASLECLATGIPLPVITWQRKSWSRGKMHWLDVAPMSGKISFSGQGNLNFEQVLAEDSGVYGCSANSVNPLNGKKSTVTRELVLEVITPPKIINPSRNVTTLIAKTVRLNCSLAVPAESAMLPYGGSLPRISWYKNGFPVVTDTRIEVRDQNQLIFVNSITKDTGSYQCLVQNEAGYATSWSYLLVNSSQDHPYPPQNLRYFLLSPTSVLLEWDVVETSSPIQAYSIHFTELGVKPEEFQVVSSTNSHLLKTLYPHTNYSFFVRAYSSQASDPSETVVFRTGEDVPLDVPEFHVKATSHTTLLVTWSQLPPEKARGTITGYKVQWQRRSKDYYNLNEVGAETFQHELTGLHPGKTYKVRVLARTKAGYNEGTDWPWKIVEMSETDEQLPPGNVPMAPIVSSQLLDNPNDIKSVNVSWIRPPEDTTPLDGYTIRYKRQNAPWSEDINLPATTTSYIITGLTPDWYRIKVRGFNGKGEGLSAIEMIATTRSKKNETSSGLPVIEEVNVTPESQTSVHLSWKVKEGTESTVAFYTIQQRVLTSSEDDVPIYTRSTRNSISIDGLAPFNTYEFTVRAHLSENQFGPYSNPVETTSISSVPTAPRDIKYEPIDASTVQLSWDFIQIPDGPPTRYQVIYAPNKSLPLSDWTQKEVDGQKLSSAVSGLVSNTEYWFRVRGCSESNCGAYSEPFSACIPAILPPNSQPSQLYLIIGLIGTLAILLLVAFLAIYILKFRNISFPTNALTCNGNGSIAGKHVDNHTRGANHSTIAIGARNGNVSDLHNSDGDYIPMLDRIHGDIPNTLLDTKGGYLNCRVNGFTNPRCNGVIRGKEFQYGGSVNSGKAVDSEECEHLFTPAATPSVHSLNRRGTVPGHLDDVPIEAESQNGGGIVHFQITKLCGIADRDCPKLPLSSLPISSIEPKNSPYYLKPEGASPPITPTNSISSPQPLQGTSPIQ